MKRKAIVCGMILLFTILGVNMFPYKIQIVSFALLLVSIVIACPTAKRKPSLSPRNVMSYAECFIGK